MLLGGGRSNAGGRNAISAPRQRPDHSGAAATGVGLEFLNLPSQPVEAWVPKASADAGAFDQRHSRVATSHGRICYEDSSRQQMPPSRGSTRSGSSLESSGRTQESHGTNHSRASTLPNDDAGAASGARARSARIQVPDIMMASTDSFDASAVNIGAATSRAERHLQRELAELKQQFQFAAVQHREDVNIMRSKLMEMQQQLSQASASRDEAYEAVVNERAVAVQRVQVSEAAHREASKMAQQLRDKLQLEEQRGRDLARAIDAAQKGVEHYKLRFETLEQQQQMQLQKLQQYEQLQLDSKRQAIAAHQAQQQLQQELQNQLQQHQHQMDALQSQLQQQLTSAQNECSASQRSLIDSERHRSLAEARANRNFEELSQAMQQLQALRAELQSAQSAVAHASTAELSLVEQKLQFTQERLDMTQSHAKSQIEAAEGRAQLAQNELLRLQGELLSASNTLASTQLQHQSLQQQVLLLKDDAKASAATAEAAAAALSTNQGRIEKLEKSLEEQKAEHLKELCKSRDDQAALRESAGQLEEQYRGMQSRCAAEENAACSERALHKETLQKVEHLTGLNQKLTAAVAVVQLQAAVGVQDLLSQAGLSSLSNKSSQHQAEFLSKAKILLQSVRQENAKLGAIASAEFSSALDSAVKICNV